VNQSKSLDLTLVEITEKVNNLESKILSLFIGLAEIERMPCDREHIIFKMMIGRLYNGKYKLKSLVKTFTVSSKTIRKWGRALLSGDISQIEKAFGGHNNKRKLTHEIEAYARGSFNVIGGRVKNFSQVILNEIESRYNVKLSGESLRPIFNDERIKSNNNCVSEEHAPSPSAPVHNPGECHFFRLRKAHAKCLNADKETFSKVVEIVKYLNKTRFPIFCVDEIRMDTFPDRL